MKSDIISLREQVLHRITKDSIRRVVSESVNRFLMTESFRSDTLRDFFQKHGGVDRNFRQFSLGDISDGQIGYAKEFDSVNDAIEENRRLTRAGNDRMRSDYDMKYLFNIYKANDGSAILVGVDRSTIKSGFHWGGEYEKKVADRLWSNGWNFKTRDNRYMDDSDTYYYQGVANDFGVHNSRDFRGKMEDRKNAMERLGWEKGGEYKKAMLARMRNYLKRHYPEMLRNPGER